jgi:uncharacterized protein YhaN
MRITGLAVDGFGVWSDLSLGELSDELAVFYGPNEAGKTTLMQFVRSVFFGFSPERRTRYLPPLGGGRPGGSIRVLAGGAECAVARHDEHGDTGELVISRGTRHAVDPEKTLAGLLGDVDEPTFNNVFVFGLREIQELATLSDSQAADELYNLALGLDRVSLVDVLRELAASRERLLAADGRPSLVTQLVSRRDRLRAEVDALQETTPRWLALASECERLDAELAAIESESARCEEQARGLALARVLSERWQRRAQLDERLKTLASAEAMPDDALARYERLQGGIAALGRRARRLVRKRNELRAHFGAFPINEALCRNALRLEALGEQQQWMQSLEKQIADVQAEITALEAQCAQGKEQWNAAAGQTISKRALRELRAAAGELRASRHEAATLHHEAAAAEGKALEVTRRVDDALGAAKEKGLTAALAEAGELVSQLRNRVQLDERIGQLSARRSELEEQGRDHLDNQMLPTWVLAGLGGLFVLGCALVLLFLAGLVLPASLGESLTWPVGLIGVGAAAAAGLTKFAMERAAEGRLDRCHQQIDLLGEQIDQAKTQRDELDARLPRGGGPLVARLQAAEKSLARLEDLLPLETQRETADHQAQTARDQAQSIRDRARSARKHWQKLLAEHGLPRDLPPKQLKAFVRGRREVAGLGAAMADKRAELGRLRGQYDAIAARVVQLVGQTGVAVRSERPLDQLQQCLTELALQQSLVKQRAELSRQLARLRRRYLKTTRRCRRLRRRRVLLLRAAGTLDEGEFRRRAALQADAGRLRAEHAELDHEISAALADGAERQQVAAWLAEGENLEPIESRVADERRAAAARLSETHERRAELKYQLKLLAEDRTLTDKRMELDTVGRRLAEALRRWRLLAVCTLALDAVRDHYEREHQPLALREASGYLQRLTAGRYRRVWTPLGEHALRVDDEAGRSLGVEVLSSGTREQLFLALRLALAGSYARRGVELPLVLDDVLVNFDVARAKAAAAVLRDFAKAGHQVLIFTCHEHIAKLFKNVKALVRDLPDCGGSSAASKAAPPRRRAVAPLAPVEPKPSPPAIEPPEVPEPPRVPRRAPARAEQVRWSAEEFEGELSDRVRREASTDEQGESDDADGQAA